MSHPPIDAITEVEGVSLAPQPVVLTQVVPLARIAPEASPSPALVIDYLPVDNHRAILNHWRQIPPFHQFTLGGILGLAVGLGLMTWVNYARKITPFISFTLNKTAVSALTQTHLDLLSARSRVSVQPSHVPILGTPISEIRPFLRPTMMDRFYLATPTPATGQAGDRASAMVVDRFYFEHQSSPGTTETVGQISPMASQPLAVPLPPPILPREDTPPSSAMGAPVELVVASGSPSAMASVPKSHRLIGVIQTGQFSAALVETAENAYSVKLGDRISQSPWQLIEVQASAVVVSNGRERQIIHVGDTF